MLGRAMLSGSLILCALGATATGPMPEYATGWAKDPWKHEGGIIGKRAGARPRDPQPACPVQPAPRHHRGEHYAIPSGACMTGVVIVPTRSYGNAIRVKLIDGCNEFPITVAPGQSFVLPFAKGWRSDCAYLVGDGCDVSDDFVAWGITDNGPIGFACVRR